ncbi:MAG TPA: DUF935 family protein, partial [Candidatus Acidoferrum sp.]|nr:DUF935 family protein [Candidatus Acidoferrum sp.]
EILQTRSIIGTDSLSADATQLIADQGDGFARFPKDKFLIGIAKTKSGHPITGAMLRLLGTWWAGMNFVPGWFLNFTQIFGMPFRWANYDTAMTPSDKTKLFQMLANMGSAAWAAFPAGTQVEFKEAMKSAGDNAHKAFMEFADKQCDILVLRQTLTTEGGTSGSRALGEVHERKEAGVETNVAEWAAKILRRQLFQPICQFNYGNTEECPWLMAEEEEKPDPKGQAEFVETANRVIDLPRTWVYETLGIPQPAAGEEVIERQQQSAPGILPGPGDEIGAQAKDPAGRRGHFFPVRAKDATERVANVALEELTGIQTKWLAPVKPHFVRLVQLAQDNTVSDDDFTAALAKAQNDFPELFGKLNTDVLATALEKAMGAAAANGAIVGYMTRRSLRTATGGKQ